MASESESESEPTPEIKCGPGAEIVDGICQVKKSWFQSNYMLKTSAVAFATALTNLIIIIWMNVTDGLDLGLGLAAIGIITFFGVSLSSSIFEEHRHKHGNEQKSNLIPNIIAGKGIMRKGLAASLVMSYIVLIGLSFNAGTLDNSIRADTIANIYNGSSLDRYLEIKNQSPNVDINISEIGIISSGVTKTDSSSKSIEELLLAKEPSTLVQHFTIVISVVIGFYFGTSALTTYLNSRKESQTLDDPLKILKARLATKDISLEEFDKLKARIET